MFVSGSIYDPSLLAILLLPSTAFSHRNFPRTAKSSFLPRTSLRSVVGTACQFSLSLSFFHLLAVSAESPNRKCKEGKGKRYEETRERKRGRGERLRMFETYLCKVRESRRRAINWNDRQCRLRPDVVFEFPCVLSFTNYEFPVFSGPRFGVLRFSAGRAIRERKVVLCFIYGGR